MKKTLSILIIALAFLSCEKEKAGPTHDTTQIVFGDVDTRAAVEDVESMKSDGFGVFGYAEETSLLENEKVYWDESNSEWTYDNTKYWIPDRTFHFLAYWPYDDDDINNNEYISDVIKSNVGYQLTFRTPGTADLDLLSAYTAVDTGADNFDASDPVSMNFGHEMVKVNLRIWRDGVKHQNDQMRVTDVTIANVPWEGTLTKTADGATSWDILSRRAQLSGTVNSETVIGSAWKESGELQTNGTSCKPFGDSGLLLIPVSNVSTIVLSVGYELKRQGGDEWEDYSLNVQLPDVAWKAGTQMTYDLLLSNVVNISFYYIGTTINPWGAPQVGGTIIIK